MTKFDQWVASLHEGHFARFRMQGDVWGRRFGANTGRIKQRAMLAEKPLMARGEKVVGGKARQYESMTFAVSRFEGVGKGQTFGHMNAVQIPTLPRFVAMRVRVGSRGFRVYDQQGVLAPSECLGTGDARDLANGLTRIAEEQQHG